MRRGHLLAGTASKHALPWDELLPRNVSVTAQEARGKICTISAGVQYDLLWQRPGYQGGTRAIEAFPHNGVDHRLLDYH